MADTNAHPLALPRGRYRFPRCPRDDTAASGQASSTLRPTARSAQWPHRHRPNRSADGGNCSRRAARVYAGKSRSTRVPRGAAAVPRRLNNQHNAVKVKASWALCRNFMGDLPGSRPWNRASPIIVPQFYKYQTICVALQQRFSGRFGVSRLPFVTAGRQNRMSLYRGRCHHAFWGLRGRN
jgi:hypothetical protein